MTRTEAIALFSLFALVIFGSYLLIVDDEPEWRDCEERVEQVAKEQSELKGFKTFPAASDVYACMINEVRVDHGLQPVGLIQPEDMGAVTEARAMGVARGEIWGMMHEGLYEDAAEIGWVAVGEIIAYDERDQVAVFQAWLDSDRHREVILDPSWKIMTHAAVSTPDKDVDLINFWDPAIKLEYSGD